MRAWAFDGSFSATELSACTFVSSRTAAGWPDPAAAGAGAAAAGGAAAGARVPACWVPIIQPAIRPKKTPAMPKAMESDFMGLNAVRLPKPGS